MKIIRSSKTTLKFLTARKRQTLYMVMDEYSKVVNIFIAMFWGNRFTLKDLTKTITNIPESWISARLRQCAAREALGMADGALKSAQETGKAAVKPTHNSHKMVLSSQIVQIEKGRNSFDLWLILTSVGNKIRIEIPLKSHRHINLFAEWNRSTTITIHRHFVQFSQGSNQQKKACKTLSYYLHKTVKGYFHQHQNLRLVVVERLKGLKQRKQKNRGKAFRKTLNNWNYRELLNIIEMRREENRVSFRSVNPYKTSQTCPVKACSHIERENRSGSKFKCRQCGYEENADTVGLLNILDRFLSGPYGAAFKTEAVVL